MYGFTTFGKSNIQIDGEMPTYFKGEEGSTTLTGVVHSPSYVEATLDITNLIVHYHHPLAAYRPLSGEFISILRWQYNSSNWNEITSLIFCRQVGSDKVPIGGDETLAYIIYLATVSATVESYGVFVKNNNGEPVFQNCESNFVGIPYEVTLAYDADPFADNYVDVTVKNADRNYFMLAPVPFCRLPNVYPGWSTLWPCCAGLKYIDSTTIRVGQFATDVPGYATGYNASPEVAQWNENLVLIEVGPDLY